MALRAPLQEHVTDNIMVFEPLRPLEVIGAEQNSILSLAERLLDKSLPAMQPNNYDLAMVLAVDNLPTEIMMPEQRQLSLDRLENRLTANILFTDLDAAVSPHEILTESLGIIFTLQKNGRDLAIGWDEISGLLNNAMTAARINDEKPDIEAIPEPIAYEFIVPGLLREINKDEPKIKLSPDNLAYLGEEEARALFKAKMMLGSPELIFMRSPLHFTLEFLHFYRDQDFAANLISTIMDPANADRLIEAFSYSPGELSGGLSTASTAGLLMLEEVAPAGQSLDVNFKEGLNKYLARISRDFEGGGYPTTHPVEAAGVHWTLLGASLHDWEGHAKLSEAEQRKLGEIIDSTITSEGYASWGGGMEKTMPDLDCTSAAFINRVQLAAMSNGEIYPFPNPEVFRKFEKGDGTYECYPIERNPSRSALLHAAIGLEKYIEKATGVDTANLEEARKHYNSILKQLVSIIGNGDFPIQDKWHTSWTYVFSRIMSIKGFVEDYPEVVANQLKVAARNFDDRDGQGFGEKYSVAEETAYALMGLNNFIANQRAELGEGVEYDIESVATLTKGAALNLARMLTTDDFYLEPRWISKTMYAPLWVYGSFTGSLKTAMTTINFSADEAAIIHNAIANVDTLFENEVNTRRT